MGLMDIFRGGSGEPMDAADRKKLFYYLQRKTSYTAWARASDAFDVFAAVYKKQVMQESKAPGSIFGATEWDLWYTDILRAQVWFEQGLKALRQGDHSVWLYNSRGVLRDALMTGAHWYTELIFGGERGDHQYFGKYLDEMKIAITRFNAVQQDVGYLQSKMTDTPASEFWGEWLQSVLNNQPFPRKSVDGIEPALQASPLRYPDPLPEVPVPARQVLVSTGQPVPVDGIWEPQVKNGCMNYMMQDTEALLLDQEGGSPRDVVWKLVWEDTRYTDGDIPAEERLYFVPDAAPATAQAVVTADLVTAQSGELCPRDGDWAVMDEIHTKMSLVGGRKMPQSQGRDVQWVWVGKYRK